MSATGLCYVCGKERREANICQLAAREGPYYDHFVRRRFMAAYAQALKLDAQKAS